MLKGFQSSWKFLQLSLKKRMHTLQHPDSSWPLTLITMLMSLVGEEQRFHSLKSNVMKQERNGAVSCQRQNFVSGLPTKKRTFPLRGLFPRNTVLDGFISYFIKVPSANCDPSLRNQLTAVVKASISLRQGVVYI
ncbi:hypothetical protein CEXT_597801 [Caerostris extrusa]|uniref:Uncharacterized protein n=1 Tax=Caerostris extrusa TaxID=172846 RepID=A0AAV4X438_CAEEX|nr:hypothetical protein CEXT_597801 [Caerostris extrusa]